jgi:hypothetical protein
MMAKRRARQVVALAAVKNLGNAGAPRVLDQYPHDCAITVAPIVKVSSNDQQ